MYELKRHPYLGYYTLLINGKFAGNYDTASEALKAADTMEE